MLIVGCGGGNERIYQYSTMNALMAGCYQGQFRCGELTNRGDFGIGTFDKLDGEMVLVDGTVYQVRADGRVGRPSQDLLTPFAVVTRFDCDQQIRLQGKYSWADLQEEIDDRLPSENIFYAVRIEGEFEYVRTRSVPAQQKPYPKLTEVVKEQPVFEIAGTRGVLVGFRCPDYIFPLNVPGYHLHFVSDRRNCGGHLLDCRLRDPVTISITFGE